MLLSLDGEPDSANCPISGSVPFTWTAKDSNGATIMTGSGTLNFSAPATPPCDNCQPPAPGSVTTVQAQSTQSGTTLTESQAPAAEKKAVETTAPLVESTPVAEESATPSATPTATPSTN